MGLVIAVAAALMSLVTTETRAQALEHPEGLDADDVVSAES